MSVLAAVAIAAALLARFEVRSHARSLAEHTAMLEELAAELSRANRAKGEFLANVSHELRTPLAAIVGFVEMLREGAYGELSPRQAGPVERIEASANHLRKLVDDILDLSRLAAAKMEVHEEAIALHTFVFDVASEMESLMTARSLAFSISVSPALPRLRTDPTHLRQILVNLIGNAVKYTPSGTIAIRARLIDTSGRERDRAQLPERLPGAHGVWIALAVQDTGVGIAREDHKRVFDEFEQVDAGPRGDSMRRGTGLGLSISRRLADLLGGDITLESALGKGATFTLWLPVDPVDLSAPVSS
ncbi:MAG TPA: HAMP domain-containing sensor histidine kinase [Gemmatimonadaceae bacterium]|nr:HAMP domain-containing sensor histidine kinase [Gemmatimonadaceae bacterium]